MIFTFLTPLIFDGLQPPAFLYILKLSIQPRTATEAELIYSSSSGEFTEKEGLSMQKWSECLTENELVLLLLL